VFDALPPPCEPLPVRDAPAARRAAMWEESPGGRKARPLLLVFSGGSFLFQVPYRHTLRWAREQGFQARQVFYPLADLAGAWRAARDAAVDAHRRWRPIYAWGDSAGGVLAARLAQLGLTSAAAAVAGPVNLISWPYGQNDSASPEYGFWNLIENSGRQTRRYVSPVFHPTANRVLVVHGRDDPVVPFEINRRWAARDPKVRLRVSPSTHDLSQTAVNERNHKLSLRWLWRDFQRRLSRRRACG
jgi:acetyl esterase/lipase